MRNQSNLNVAAGAFFNLRNNNVSVATLTGAGSVFNDFATNTLTIGVANGTGGNFTGTMTGGGGVLNVVKTGTGTQTLSGGAINYTGTTAVNVGQLVLFNATAITRPRPSHRAPRSPGAAITTCRTTIPARPYLLNNGAVLQNTNPNHWTVINGAVTVSCRRQCDH